jgi:alanyl-tRNA synthetase
VNAVLQPHDYDKSKDIHIEYITDNLTQIIKHVDDGLRPSSRGEGYKLRKLFRQVMYILIELNIDIKAMETLHNIDCFCMDESNLRNNSLLIKNMFAQETSKFYKIMKKAEYIISKKKRKMTSVQIFQTYGIPCIIIQQVLNRNVK